MLSVNLSLWQQGSLVASLSQNLCDPPRTPMPEPHELIPAAEPPPGTVAEKIGEAILRFLGKTPDSAETESLSPYQKAESIGHAAARKAGMTAGMLALPAGPIAWLTMIPEMIGVWRIQGQMVADIAAVYGKTGELTRERMIYCLFRHTAAQAMRDIMVRVGERYIARRTTLRTLQKVAGKVGVKITETTIRSSLGRWIPVAGALGVGAYAYLDTRKVARTAIDVFSSTIDVEVEVIDAGEERHIDA